jgi:hypothetical protein
MFGMSSLWQLDKEVEGALIPNSMQRVSKCKLVGLCGAAARRRGGQNITLSIQKVFDCKRYNTKYTHAYRSSIRRLCFSPRLPHIRLTCPSRVSSANIPSCPRLSVLGVWIWGDPMLRVPQL